MWLKDDYYIWLLEYTQISQDDCEKYSSLLRYLFSEEFVYVMILDKNRAAAGETLRNKYSYDCGIFLEDIRNDSCSVLEMIIALADTIAFDNGDSISKWFWELIGNLGLTCFDDRCFNEDQVKAIISVWMYRLYDSKGHGSIFPVDDFDGDMRKLEIWDQKNVYLTSKYPIGEWIE